MNLKTKEDLFFSPRFVRDTFLRNVALLAVRKFLTDGSLASFPLGEEIKEF